MILTTNAVPATAPLQGATLRTALSRFFSRALHLRGRASRSEYWWWMLVNIVTMTILQLVLPALIHGRALDGTLAVGPFGSLVFSTIDAATWSGPEAVMSPTVALLSIISGGWLLLTAIPGVTVAVRRLHDSNLSGWWALIAITPPGAFVLLVLAMRRSRVEGLRFD